ncbi:hypothetical protein Hdeb2414_s0032g00714211 [Helianthus debilis subsp. tardiflorus]
MLNIHSFVLNPCAQALKLLSQNLKNLKAVIVVQRMPVPLMEVNRSKNLCWEITGQTQLLLLSFDPQRVANEGVADNIILENLDSGESSGQNHSDVTRWLDSDTRALLVLSDSFVSFRTFGSGFETSGTEILIVELGSVSPDVLSGGVSDISSRGLHQQKSHIQIQVFKSCEEEANKVTAGKREWRPPWRLPMTSPNSVGRTEWWPPWNITKYLQSSSLRARILQAGGNDMCISLRPKPTLSCISMSQSKRGLLHAFVTLFP